MVLALFFLVRTTYRPHVLLGASLVFYGLLNPAILFLLIITVWLNHMGALRLARMGGDGPERKRILILLIGINLSFLAFFKYTGFLVGIISATLSIPIFHTPLHVPSIVLPIGISFYTFQLTSYVVDVYNSRIKAESSYIRVLLYTLYFPQLVAGPIERAENLIPALANPTGPTRDDLKRGAFLFLEGLFKKLAVADLISPVVDASLLPGAPVPTWGHWVTAILFSIQIYADFSGYTDMARGVSLFFGIHLTENFKLPFFAPHPSEFWRRWHITLMAFLRDYLYFPLGGSAGSGWRTFLNVLIVFGLGGLWHGASFGHLAWGLYSGLLVALTGLLFRKSTLSRIEKEFQFLIPGVTFTYLSFALGTLLIRMKSFDHFVVVFSHLLPAWGSPIPGWFFLSLLFAFPMLGSDLFRAIRGNQPTYDTYSNRTRPFLALFWLTAVLLYGAGDSKDFIYFQF